MSFLAENFGFAWQDYNGWTVRWGYDGPPWLYAFLAVLILAALRFFWTSLRRIPSLRIKCFLFSLRIAVFALLLLALLQPSLEFNKARALKNIVAILLDDSKSMSIKTFPEEKERIALVREAIESNREVFAGWEKDYQLDFYFVSDHIEAVPPGELSARYRPRGNHTDLDRVLLDLLEQYQGKSLQGVVLFTDGADLGQETSAIPQRLARTLAGFAGPVHTLQAGSDEGFKDIRIESADSGDFGFVYQPLNIVVTIAAVSMGARSIPLVLKEGKKILASKTVQLRPGQRRYTAEFQLTPTTAGKNIYSLSIPVFVGEAIESNNRLDFQVKIMRDRIRVLHLTGRPSWDSRFLREVLANNPKVELLSFFILRSLTDNVQASTGELSLIPFPTNLLFSEYLSSFDLVIFHNFKYSPFISRDHLENIRDYVKNGGAFIMVGGDQSFHGGDYRGTALEDILPVTIKKSAAIILPDEFKIMIDNQMTNHPILRLDKNGQLNKKIWDALPPLNGLNIGIAVRKDAQALAGFRKDARSPFYPLLVTRKIGKGRSMVFASDTSWNWNFRKVGEGGSGRHYQKFWDNVIAWMTDAPATRLAKVETDKEKYREGEKVLVKFQALAKDYNPLPKAKVKLSINRLGGAKGLENVDLQTDSDGFGRHEFLPPQEGFYSAQITVEAKDGPATYKTIFKVSSPTAEFQKPLVNEKLLKYIAATTGGAYSVLKGKTSLATLAFPNPEIRVQASGRTISLWDSWWTYGMVLGLLCLDWWLRRKSGLS